MIESLLIAAPAALGGGLAAQALLRRSPRIGVRWLVRVNVTIAGASAVAVLLMLAAWLIRPRLPPRLPRAAVRATRFGGGIAVAGSTIGAGLAVSYTGSARWPRSPKSRTCLGARW